jgi:2-haloacid dehalogenase
MRSSCTAAGDGARVDVPCSAINLRVCAARGATYGQHGEMAPPEVVVLDVNETLSDFTSLRRRCRSVGAPAPLLDLWFASVLRDGIALAGAGGYASFQEIGRALLIDMFRHESGVEADPAEAAEHVLDAFAALDVHRDVPDGLRRLHDGGVRLVTLTNGPAELTDELLQRAGLRDLIEHVLSADDVQRWKPFPEPYLYAAKVAEVSPDRAAMVAVHPWDVDGAIRAGLLGAFLGRGGHVYPSFFGQPTVRAASLPDLAAALLAL